MSEPSSDTHPPDGPKSGLGPKKKKPAVDTAATGTAQNLESGSDTSDDRRPKVAGLGVEKP